MEKVRQILASTFRIKETDITENTELKDIKTWDSLTHMEMIADLETSLNIEFDVDEIMQMTDVKTIEAIVAGKLSHGN
ncbi:MAG: acyl carrier protein [Alphaproteobacteria bacterium]|nr:acyl carrier protein [Alphaproteobacteria bacterium]